MINRSHYRLNQETTFNLRPELSQCEKGRYVLWAISQLIGGEENCFHHFGRKVLVNANLPKSYKVFNILVKKMSMSLAKGVKLFQKIVTKFIVKIYVAEMPASLVKQLWIKTKKVDISALLPRLT